MSTTGKPRLLDHVREVLRLHPDSIHTERAYCAQIRRYANYHTITHREDLKDGARKIEAFLTHLAMAETVSPSNQIQAMNALVFLRNDSSLPQKVRELAMLTTARAKDCPYIWNAHVALGRQAGVSDALVGALRDREPLPPMSVEEAVVIKLGMEFFQTNRVNQDTFDVALEQFGPQGLVELTTLMG
jgi:AhpD family alkylhydroperoxidase